MAAVACSMPRQPTGADTPVPTGSTSGQHTGTTPPTRGPAAGATTTDMEGSPAPSAGMFGNGATEPGSSATAGTSSSGTAGSSDPEGSAGVNDPDPETSEAPFDPRSLHAPTPTLRRLTPLQIQLSLTELLGSEAEDVTLADIAPVNGLRSIGAASAPLADVDFERWETTAPALSSQILAHRAAGLQAELGCVVSEDSCGGEFIRRYGRRLFRRPLDEAELADYEALRTFSLSQNPDAIASLTAVLSALLQSPNFLYRVELGEPDGTATDGTKTARLTDLELASRLSFFLWNRGPDDLLLDAAEQGKLSAEPELAAQVERMLAHPNAESGFSAFIADALALYQLDDLPKIPDVYPSATPTLLAAMKEETVTFMHELLIASDQDFRTIFTTTRTYVDSELANLYGVAAPADPFTAIELPAAGPRAGLLTQGSILSLAAHSSRSSPTLRGKYIRERLLCLQIPPPPPTVNTTLPDSSSAPTARDRLQIHRTDPACAGCHSLTDPVGLALENFDGIGAFRENENGVAIDPSGELDGTTFGSARELGAAVGEHPSLSSCLVTTLLRYARGTVEDRSEGAWIKDLTQQFAQQGYRVGALMRAVVLSAAFRKVGSL